MTEITPKTSKFDPKSAKNRILYVKMMQNKPKTVKIDIKMPLTSNISGKLPEGVDG